MKRSNRVSLPCGDDLVQVKKSCPNVGDYNNHPVYVALNGRSHTSPLREKRLCMPQIPWTCPPKFVLRDEWRVAAGEGSEEAEIQRQRERMILEASMRCPPAVPTSSTILSDSLGECYDDCHTPVIPTIPIEEVKTDLPSCKSAQDLCVDSRRALPSENYPVSENLTSPLRNPPIPERPSTSGKSTLDIMNGLEGGDLVVAAGAAATVAAILKSQEEGNLIDTDLLIKLLSNPKMLEKLINENGLSAKGNPGTRAAQASCAPIPRLSATSDSLVNKLGNDHSEPSSPEMSASFRPESLNQWPPMTSRKAETVINKSASEIGTTRAGDVSMFSCKPANILMPLPRPSAGTVPIMSLEPAEMSISEPRPQANMLLDESLRNENRVPPLVGSSPTEWVNLVTPTLASTSKPNVDMIKRMIQEYGPPNAGGTLLPELKSQFHTSTSKSAHAMSSGPSPFPMTNMLVADLPIEPLSPGSNSFMSSSVSNPSSHAAKDMNYYKSLIKQHGEEYKILKSAQPDNTDLKGLESMPNTLPTKASSNYQRACIFFNSPRGCRKGSACTFRHDMACSAPEMPPRMSLSRT